MTESLRRYKNSYYFKNYSTYDDFLNDQLNIHVQNPDLELLKNLHDKNELSSGYVIKSITNCPLSSLPFYTRYLFYDFKAEAIDALVLKFQKEQDEDNKLLIYNCLRPLINHLTVEEVLSKVDQGILSILVGEYGRKHNLQFEALGSSNVSLKFLGYHCLEDMEEIEKYVEMDIDVIRIVSLFSKDHFNLENVLKKDEHLQFYLENCPINPSLVKNLHPNYNPFTFYLLFDKLRNETEFCKKKLKEMKKEDLLNVYLLFLVDEKWVAKYFPKQEEPFEQLKVKNECVLEGENDFLRLINSKKQHKTDFYFEIVENLRKFIPNGKESKLREIDGVLLEKFILKRLKEYLKTVESVSIENWLSVEEVYFSLVLEKCPFLFDFHNSFLCNKKKRCQMAKDILQGEHRELFLKYLDKRGVYVDLEGEVVYDFSVYWMKLFLEENYKKLKIVKIREEEPLKIKFTEEGIEIYCNLKMLEGLKEYFKDNKKILNKIEISRDLKDAGEQLKVCFNTSKAKHSAEGKELSKRFKVECPDEKYLEELYEGKATPREFKRHGVLNKFISSHLYDLQGSARVTASVIQNQDQFDSFLRTIPFVIEDKEVLSLFIFEFLRLSKFTVSLSSVAKWEKKGVLFGGKVNLSDLNLLVEDFYSEDLEIGLLLRGYSYLLRNNPTGNKFRKVKDGDIVFYYSQNEDLQIKFNTETITYTCSDREGYLDVMRNFLNLNCSIRKKIVRRCIKVLGKEFEEKEEEKEIENKEQEVYSEEESKRLLQFFVKDPLSYLPLLPKLVKSGVKLNKQLVFELVKILKDTRGEQEETVLQLLRGYPLDREETLYILDCFEFFSFSTKVTILSFLSLPVDLKLFVKFCEVIGNEDNLEVLRVLLKGLKDKQVYFPIVENWKTNSKLSKLVLRVYPLGLKDKEFYYELLEKNKNEEEKEMLRGVFGL